MHWLDVDKSLLLVDTVNIGVHLQEHTGRVFRLQFDEFQIVSSSHDDTILIWDFLDPRPGVPLGQVDQNLGVNPQSLAAMAAAAMPPHVLHPHNDEASENG